MFGQCNCGLTGGCGRCNTKNYPLIDIDKYNLGNLPKVQREGWICPKCDVSNSPDNKICDSCQPIGFVYLENFTGVTFVDGNHG